MNISELKIHYEKDEYPGFFQVESLCGYKRVMNTQGWGHKEDDMTQDKQRVTCNVCKKILQSKP